MMLWITAALAHGPPAAVTGVVASDAAGPVVVALTEGLAVRVDAGWRYVCPTAWGGAPLAPYAGGPPGAVLLPGADDLYGIDAAGRATPTGHPELSASSLLDLQVDADGAVWALYTDGGTGRVLWDLTGPAIAWSDAASWSSMALGPDGVEVARADGGELVHRVLASGEDARLGPVEGLSPLLRIAGGDRFVVDRGADGLALSTLPERAPLAVAVVALRGPIAADGAVWFTVDGLLWRYDGTGAPVRAAADDNLGCLADTPSGPWACARELWPLVDGALGSAPLFALEAVLPPDLALLPEAQQIACWGDWRLFALDVGIEPGDMPTASSPPEEEEGGCGGSSVLPFGLWSLTSLRRRKNPEHGAENR